MDFNGPNWGTTTVSIGNAEVMLQAMREQDLEGIMAKHLDSPYLPGKRSDRWIKIRNRPRQEFVVGGWSEGEGARSGTIGSLFVGYYPQRGLGRRLRFVGRVGSGYRDADLALLDRELAS